MGRYSKQSHTFTSDGIVTLVEFKRQLQFDDPAVAHDEDLLLQSYIKAAISYAENKIQTALMEVKYLVEGISFTEVLAFKKQRVKSVDSFEYKPVDYTTGPLTVVPSELYELTTVDDFEQRVSYLDEDALPEVKADTKDAVKLTVILGFDEIPDDVKQAVILVASDMYNNRTDTVKEKVTAADKLLAPYRYYPINE